MSFSKDEVSRLAKLSRLALSADEQEAMGKELDKIVGYVNCLKDAPVDDLEPFIYPGELENVMRDDVLAPSLATSDVLDNAPKSDSQYYFVPKVIE